MGLFSCMVKIVAEIGCNHCGSMDIAIKMIAVAKECGADYVKFQKRDIKTLLSEEEYNAPHPNPHNSYGQTYGEHREFLEFTREQHAMLKTVCNKVGIKYACSVWDIKSFEDIMMLSPEFIKVPSACNCNRQLLERILTEYNGDIHLSLGMTSKQEIESIMELASLYNAMDRVVLYHCTSGYPISFDDVCLLEIPKLKERYKVKAIGYSGHHLGIAVDSAAVALGATWIERHFTLDRTWKGTDHAASLEPEGLRKLVRDCHAIERAMREKDGILDIEVAQRDKLKKVIW